MGSNIPPPLFILIEIMGVGCCLSSTLELQLSHPPTHSHPTLKLLGFRDPKILLNLGGNQSSKPRRGPAPQSRRVSQGAEDLGLRCPPATAQIGQRPPRAPVPISTPGYKLLGENFGSGLGFGLPSQHGVQFRLPYIEISVRVSASASHANLM